MADRLVPSVVVSSCLRRSGSGRAIKSGKISGTKDALGQWWVEPAELHRVPKPAGEHVRLVPDKIYPGMWRVVGPILLQKYFARLSA